MKILEMSAVVMAAMVLTGCGTYSAGNAMQSGASSAVMPATIGAQPEITVVLLRCRAARCSLDRWPPGLRRICPDTGLDTGEGGCVPGIWPGRGVQIILCTAMPREPFEV